MKYFDLFHKYELNENLICLFEIIFKSPPQWQQKEPRYTREKIKYSDCMARVILLQGDLLYTHTILSHIVTRLTRVLFMWAQLS
jgi:hypothetical protein